VDNCQVYITGIGGVHELNIQMSTLELEGKLLSADLALSNLGETPVYQQLTISGYPQVPPAPGGDNLSISREYLGMNGQ
uniref:hypothetical protein n=1 Tax=Pseudomonas sp. MD332_6 TaxID=3241256 RepID=UPI0036D2FDAF